MLKANEEEAAVLLEQSTAEAQARRYAVEEFVVTRGAAGATVCSPEGEQRVSALPVTPRHPVGAGDVFFAGYLFARTRGDAIGEAAAFGCRLAEKHLEEGS